MTRPLISLETIAGTDVGAMDESWRLPEVPLFILANVRQGLSLGALTVCDSRGSVQDAGHMLGGMFGVTLGPGSARNEIVIEPANHPHRYVDPCDRGYPDYAAFRIEVAREVALENGGRLLVAGVITGNSSASSLEIRPSEVGDPIDLLHTQIHRITSSIAETELTLQAIGMYVGLSEADSITLAETALDFRGY